MWLLRRGLRRAPLRFLLEAVAVAFPVAMLAATLWFVDAAVLAMTPNALWPIQIEMRAVAKSLDVNIRAISAKLSTPSGVRLAEPFGAAKVLVSAGSSGQFTARLFAVDPAYVAHHPWVKPVTGSLGRGVLLSQSIHSLPGFEAAKSITISLPGDAPELNLPLPVGGVADLREASTWFSVPYGEVQGDIVTVPRAVVIDFNTFERDILPVLRAWAKEGGLPAFDPGADELPSASLEAHITVDHAAYPPNPGQAALWSGQLQRVLGRAAGGTSVIVADNAAEVLVESQEDAVNAKILFLLLGIPGAIVAMALGLVTASTLVEAYRREEALLRMRGATQAQIARLASTQALVAGLAGSGIGLAAAAVAVSLATGRPVWQGVPAHELWLSALLGVAAGGLSAGLRIARLWRAGYRADISERRLLTLDWSPLWRRAHLDVWSIAVGIAILAANYLAGGLKKSPIEGPAVMLSFYVLLAPIALWIGMTLLAIRGLLAALAAWARPEEHACPLPSWRGAALRWLGRRPAPAARALAVGALAIAFGAEVLAFASTYREAKQADARAAIGSDLRLTPGDARFALPPLGPEIRAITPIRIVPARADTDRKSILAIEPQSYAAATTSAPRILLGVGIEGLVNDPTGVLINTEIAESFEVGPGDMLPLTIFPDDFESSSDLELRILGIYSSFAPTYPGTEVVTTVAALPRASLVSPNFYLARVAPPASPARVAAHLRSGPLAQKFVVATATAPNERGLTALSLDGLSAIEAIGASALGAIGVAVLGAFMVIERRREYAVLQSVGADIRQLLTGPILEGCGVVVFSIMLGVPIGLGLAGLAVQVLGLFFSLAPPPLVVPISELAALVLLLAVASALALGVTLAAIIRDRPAAILRAP